MKKIMLIGAALSLIGCAAMFDGSHQDLTVMTTNDKSDNTLCVASNEEGTWTNIMPAQAKEIEKDGNTLSVRCENPTQLGVGTSESKFQGEYLVLDLLLDYCIISCWVDGISNSFYQYPSSIVIPMKDKQNQK